MQNMIESQQKIDSTHLEPYDFSSIPCRVSWRELISILHLSSLAIFDCFINDIAVTKVSIALAKSPEIDITASVKSFLVWQSDEF